MITHARLLAILPLVAVATTTATNTTAQSLDRNNPINAVVPKTNFTVELVDVIQIPNSSNQAPRLDLLTPVPDQSGRLVVNDQRGRLFAFQPGDLQPTPIFDGNALPGYAATGFERGVRSFTFHPDFDQPNAPGFAKAYVAYSTFDGSGSNTFPTPSGFGTNHYSAIAEFDVNPDTLDFDLSSRRDVLKVAQPFSNHNMAQIAFKPGTQPGDPEHGLLYVGNGDGGSANDPVNAGQRTDSLLGKILRINPLQTGNQSYSVPSDNPFLDTSTPNEIWATGFRAPTRITWDDPTLGGDGRMYINEIGQDAVEEINVGRPGANYGWKIREGTFVNDGNGNIARLPANHPNDIYSYPVAQYDHDFDNDNQKEDLVASIGGSVSRDPNLPQLFGHYLFGDFANQSDSPIYVVPVEDLVERDDFSNVDQLFDGRLAPYENLRLTRNGVEIDSFEALLKQTTGNANQDRTDLRFGYDNQGGVYVLNKHDGWVRKLMASPRQLTDFDFSGSSDANDIDRLTDAFGSIGTNDAIFNLVTTGPSAAFIDAADLDAFLQAIGSLPGDANLNGTVEQADLDVVLTNWGTNDQGWAQGDFNANGTIEQADLDVVLTHWGQSAAPSFALNPNLVPEPAAAAFLGLLALGQTRQRRHA